MNVNFDSPMNDKAKKMLDRYTREQLLPKPTVMDEFRALYDDSIDIPRRKLTELARAAKQPVKVELNALDDIKVMSDGTMYKVTKRGWIKIKRKD